MKLTKIEEQGLRLTLALARMGGQGGLADLAKEEGFTTALVAKVIGMLRRGGLIRAVRGRHGGYELTSEPSEIDVGSVLRSIRSIRSEGKSVLHGCFNSGDDGCETKCPHVSGCGLRPLFSQLEDLLSNYLGNLTLEDLLQEEKAVQKKVSDVELSFEMAPASSEQGGS